MYVSCHVLPHRQQDYSKRIYNRPQVGLSVVTMDLALIAQYCVYRCVCLCLSVYLVYSVPNSECEPMPTC